MGSDRVVVVGAAGFGRECLDVLEAMASKGAHIDVLGVVDDSPSIANLERLRAREVAYLGTVDEWLNSGSSAGVSYVLGIGSPPIRRRLVARLEGRGFQAFNAIHPSATFGANTTLERGVVVCSGAVVSNNVKLGRHVHLNPNATVGHDAVLKEFVSVNPGAIVSGEVLLEQEVLVGAGATVLQGLTVGRGATVGAAALVTKAVPPGVVVKGVPGVWTGSVWSQSKRSTHENGTSS